MKSNIRKFIIIIGLGLGMMLGASAQLYSENVEPWNRGPKDYSSVDRKFLEQLASDFFSCVPLWLYAIKIDESWLNPVHAGAWSGDMESTTRKIIKANKELLSSTKWLQDLNGVGCDLTTH